MSLYRFTLYTIKAFVLTIKNKNKKPTHTHKKKSVHKFINNVVKTSTSSTVPVKNFKCIFESAKVKMERFQYNVQF